MPYLGIAWVRDKSIPAGQKAKGQLRCRCGGRPWCNYDANEHVTCPDCGQEFDGTGKILARQISARELADLSNEWENPTVDTRKYYQNVWKAWETCQANYEQWKKDGGLCQVHDERYYIA